MSILDDFGDTVTVYRGNQGDWGTTENVSTSGTARTGMLQTVSARSAGDYTAEGQRKTIRVFFTSNPSIDENDLLKVTTVGGETYDLHVDAIQKDANPNHTTVVWFVDCHELTQAEFPPII